MATKNRKIIRVEFLTGVQINHNSIQSVTTVKDKSARAVDEIWREDGMTFIEQKGTVTSVPDAIVRLWIWEPDEQQKAK